MTELMCPWRLCRHRENKEDEKALCTKKKVTLDDGVEEISECPRCFFENQIEVEEALICKDFQGF